MVVSTQHSLLENTCGGRCWRRSVQRRYADAPETHQELVVLHAFSGSARYLLDGNVIELHAGSLLWALAGQSHVLLSDSADFDMWVYLISDRILTADMRAGSQFPPLAKSERDDEPQARTLGPGASAELLSIAETQAVLTEPEAQRTGLQWWLLRAWHHWNAAPHGLYEEVHPAVNTAARMLTLNPEIELRDLATRIGISSGRLGRLFRQQTGTGIVAFRNEQRLIKIDTILQTDSRANLLSAALDAGFGSYTQFYRAFQEKHGTSPKTWYRTQKMRASGPHF